MVTVHPLQDIWKKIDTLAGKDTAMDVSYVEKALLNGNLRNALAFININN
jgi:hypothetical protein